MVKGYKDERFYVRDDGSAESLQYGSLCIIDPGAGIVRRWMLRHEAGTYTTYGLQKSWVAASLMPFVDERNSVEETVAWNRSNVFEECVDIAFDVRLAQFKETVRYGMCMIKSSNINSL